jgi:hypothetical protein
MQKSMGASTTMTRPPLSDDWEGSSDDVVHGRRESGRFVSAYGMHMISGPAGEFATLCGVVSGQGGKGRLVG